MRIFGIAGFLLAITLFCPLQGFGQSSEDEVFTIFQCIPGSCVDTVGPTKQGIATVVFHAECTTGIVFQGQIQAIVGVQGPCNVFLSGLAEAKALRSELLDDCGNPFFLDTLQENGELFDLAGQVIFAQSTEAGCDGGEGNPTVFGTIPC